MARLARKLQSDLCAKLIGFTSDIVNSENFLDKHRKNPKDFIRNRSLPFPILINFLSNMNKGSIQDELDHYFKALNNADVAERVVSNSALTKARKKVKHEAFIDLNEHINHYFYDIFPHQTWRGFNLLAVDGSTAALLSLLENAEHFGQWNPTNGDPRPVARISQMFDVLNRITIDAIISPKSNGERELAAQHFLKLMPNDLILLDRGYPAFWLFKLIVSMGADFCARISYDVWKVVKKFFNSGKKGKTIELKCSYKSGKECRKMGLDTKPMKLRLVRIELDTGEAEILITSLTEKEAYPNDIFDELYHLRWPVEEDYKVMKLRLEVENWSGKTVHSVYQDFHAKVFAKNLTAMLAHPTRPIIKEQYAHRKYLYQLNFTQALSKTKDTIVLLFNRTSDAVREIIAKLHDIFIKTVEPVRPDRKYPRNHKIRRKPFYPNYKPAR